MNIGHNKQVSLEKDITTLFFINQGKSRADLVFEKDAYKPDEVANVICKLDNTMCEKDISEV